MNTAPDNPLTNALGAGINVSMVEKAIEVSGYPLQLIVAKNLSPQFSLQEEWSFVDPDSGAARTIDLVASKRLFEFKEPQPRVRPSLNLVIECKQSDLPYVFFLSDSYPWLPDFPVISGLKTRDIVITSDDDPSSWTFRPLHVLELDRHPFLREAVPLCITFSKCVRKGNDLTLSGSDPYQSLVFPILKAVWHFDRTRRPPSTAYYYDCEMVIGLGIIDAPMIGVRLNASGYKTELLPWVRVIRHQPWKGRHKYDCSRVFGIEIVHKDYLTTYIEQHLKPFAEEFAHLVLKHAHVLADARGFIPSMGENSWTQIESRLQRVSFGSSRKRFGAVFRRIARFFRKTEQMQLPSKEVDSDE
jgi:hypothetical protein